VIFWAQQNFQFCVQETAVVSLHQKSFGFFSVALGNFDSIFIIIQSFLQNLGILDNSFIICLFFCKSMILEYLLERHERSIDVIAIMTQGEIFAEGILRDLQKSRESRLVCFYPVIYDDPSAAELGAHPLWGFKARQKYDAARARGHIPRTLSFANFAARPESRFYENPTPANVALLVDRGINKGRTLFSAVADLRNLGYTTIYAYNQMSMYEGLPGRCLVIPTEKQTLKIVAGNDFDLL